jgi:hypothetical protein
MATRTTKDASLQSTKQMLDELDAMMEKMLALPVNDPEEAAPFPGEVVKAPSLTPTLSATLTLLEPPARSMPPHPAVNPPHLTPVAEPPMEQEPAPQPAPLTNEVTPPSVAPKLEPLLEDIPDPETPAATQLVYLPLLWINLLFDQATMLLPGGAWFRTPAGRALLGLIGIVLLGVATGWFLKDWLGWN